ncbi:DUF1656 domain-containing protein [Burkholderia cepacia]|uniref:DUF1656 domain-containing protein n=1 Tax=Burkholderia cepacia TaxID=292 RepID=UPI002AB75CED|nr:DUF1656 domain-containing protein [Burkholderia cepacia]
MKMTSDFDVLGVYVPPLVLVAIASLALLMVLRRVLVRVPGYHAFPYRDVFGLALYFILLAALLFVFGGPTITPLFD